MAQTLDNEIQKYLPLLGNSEKKSLLSVIKSFLSLNNESEGTISIEEYNKELEDAEAEFERGDYISHKEMMGRMNTMSYFSWDYPGTTYRSKIEATQAHKE